MYRILICPLALTAWLFAGAPAAGQDDENLEPALELIEVTNADAILEQMVPAILAQQSVLLRRERPGLSEDQLRSFRAHLRDRIEGAHREFLQRMARLYLKHLSEEEIETLSAFYQTPVGRKSVEVMPRVMAETVAMGDAWGRQVGERARARYEESLE